MDEMEESNSSLGGPLDFLRLLWAVDHGLQSASKMMERSLGVTGPQRLVLRLVGARPGISAGEVADVLHLDPSTLTGVLRRLVSQGRLKSAEDPRDRRRKILTLTARGKRLGRETAGTVEASVRRTLAASARRDIDAAGRLLRLLSEDLVRLARRPGRPRDRRAGR